MGPAAIVVVGSDSQPFDVAARASASAKDILPEPLSCISILGRSVIERTIERLVRADAVVSVLVAREAATGMGDISVTGESLKIQVVADVNSAVTRKLQEYSQDGIEYSFVLSASTYAETDLLDLFYFHREARQSVTRAFDSSGPLDLWVVTCAKACHEDLPTFLGRKSAAGSSYFVREYVKRLAHPQDLRQFATDVLQNRCAVRPAGREIKPGVWVDEGAEVHRQARIVAPAYIGRGSEVQQDALVTRSSNIEENCCIESGTVVEDSSILSNTHVGIWLDVCHAIAAGNLFLSLQRDVALEISDPAIIRTNSSLRRTKGGNLGLIQWNDAQDDAHEVVPETQPVVVLKPLELSLEKPPASEEWQLGANPIQG